MSGSLRTALALVVFGLFLACAFILFRRRTLVAWAVGAAAASSAPLIFGVALHPMLCIAAYGLLTLFAGMIALLTLVGKEIPIC